MPVFLYTAMDAKGQEQKGKKEAANEEEVQSFLKNQGLFPTSIKNADKSQEKKKAKGGAQKSSGLSMNISLGPAVMKTKEITLFTRQMAILLDAGLPLIRSLKTLARQAKSPVVRKIIEETATAVE
ncbi:MAG: type II secretion system F family protein, partial [Lentisphaeria bacterium]|nr:type II secretion system F family protein [Lentisphaeria bacterium]